MKPHALTSITNTNSLIRWIDDDIVLLRWSPEVDIERADIDELDHSFQKLTGGEPVKVLTDLGRYSNISSDAREYAAETSPELIAIGYVIQSLSQRIALKFYIKLRKRPCPTKVFDNYDAALEWLKTI